MSPSPSYLDGSRKRKLSDEETTPSKRSRSDEIKSHISGLVGFFVNPIKNTYRRLTTSQFYQDLSHSFSQEYQGPELEGPEVTTTPQTGFTPQTPQTALAPTIVSNLTTTSGFPSSFVSGFGPGSMGIPNQASSGYCNPAIPHSVGLNSAVGPHSSAYSGPSLGISASATFPNHGFSAPTSPTFATFTQPATQISSTNSTVNHGPANPLQSLHGMAGSGHNVQNNFGFEGAQSHQPHQLPLLSKVTPGPGFGKFTPGGFSTPNSSNSTQSHHMYFSHTVGSHQMPSHQVTSRRTNSSSQSLAAERTPLKFKSSNSNAAASPRLSKATSQKSSFDKLYGLLPQSLRLGPSVKTPTKLFSRSSKQRPDSPYQGFGIIHSKRPRRKPYVVNQSIDLEEKEKYQQLIKTYGMKFVGWPSKTKVVTLGYNSSAVSHSPPKSNIRLETGSQLKPIKLDDSDKEVESISPKVTTEIVLDDSVEKDEIFQVPMPVQDLSVIECPTDKDDRDVILESHPPTNDDCRHSPSSPRRHSPRRRQKSRSDQTKCKNDNTDDHEVTVEKHIIDISSDGKNQEKSNESSQSRESLSSAKSSTSSAKSLAFVVEKEQVLNLADENDATIIRPKSTQFMPKKPSSVRKINVNTEPDWIQRMGQLPFTDPSWLGQQKHNRNVDKKRSEEAAEEEKAKLVVLEKQREDETKELIELTSRKLKLSSRIKPPPEEIELVSSESEEEEEEEEDKDFKRLTDEMEDEVEAATHPHPPMEVLASAFKLDIHRKDIKTLVGLEWLNDEIINFYLNMLVDRSEKSEGALPKVYTFNTFFYPTLIKDGYARLKRWTRKVDLFSYDIVLVPVHLQMHWCLAVIDMTEQKVDYYDSMGGQNNNCLNALKTYLLEEHKDKKKSELCLDGWRFSCLQDIPQQMNGSDCGMFTCKFAEYASRRAPINFSQDNMPYFRRRMIYEIIKLKLF